MPVEHRLSWDDQDDRQEHAYQEDNLVYSVGSRTLALANKHEISDNHSIVENSLGLIREVADPLIRLQVLESLSLELEAERARIIVDLSN